MVFDAVFPIEHLKRRQVPPSTGLPPPASAKSSGARPRGIGRQAFAKSWAQKEIASRLSETFDFVPGGVQVDYQRNVKLFCRSLRGQRFVTQNLCGQDQDNAQLRR